MFGIDVVGESGRKRKPSEVWLARFRTRDFPDPIHEALEIDRNRGGQMGSYAILVRRPSLAYHGKALGDTAEYWLVLTCSLQSPRHCVLDRHAGLRGTPSVWRVDTLHQEDALSFRPLCSLAWLAFPDTTMLALEAWDIDDAAAQSTLHVPPLSPRVPGPLCPVPTARVHRRSTRTLADLPWGADAVRLQLGVRQFFCGNAACPRPLCTARLPTVAAPGARQPLRLAERLRALGSARGGAAGTRRTPRFGLVASRDTLVRLVRRLPLPAVPPLSAIGVDAWAPRQRQRSGTIGVDWERQRPVARRTDREADTLATWLRMPPGGPVIARARLKA